jgi:hypothetical protein
MKRLLVLLTLALAMVAMLAVTALPAFATIHPLSRSDENIPSNGPDSLASTPAETQEPPGLSGRSNADNFAQPVSAILPANECLSPEQTGEAQEICGTNPSPLVAPQLDTAEAHAFEPNPS